MWSWGAIVPLSDPIMMQQQDVCICYHARRLSSAGWPSYSGTPSQAVGKISTSSAASSSWTSDPLCPGDEWRLSVIPSDIHPHEFQGKWCRGALLLGCKADFYEFCLQMEKGGIVKPVPARTPAAAQSEWLPEERAAATSSALTQNNCGSACEEDENSSNHSSE